MKTYRKELDTYVTHICVKEKEIALMLYEAGVISLANKYRIDLSLALENWASMRAILNSHNAKADYVGLGLWTLEYYTRSEPLDVLPSMETTSSKCDSIW